jgi:ParB-like chromosome segregation protein Spo0J
MLVTDTYPIENVAIDTVDVWDRNPRSIMRDRYEALKKSLRATPEMMAARPLAVWHDRVIAGNMRLRALRDLGWSTVPIVRVDHLDEDAAKLWALRDNNEYGEWDDTALGELLAEMYANDIDLSLAGFSDASLTSLLHGVGLGDPGDASTSLPPTEYGVIVTVADETAQLACIALLQEAGYDDVRAVL